MIKKYNPKRRLRSKADRLWYQQCIEWYGELCEVCGQIAHHIHHFFPKGNYGFLRYDIENGVPICNRCHHRHHFIGDPTIHQAIIENRGQEWYKSLVKKSKIRPTSYMTIKWYKDNIKRLENI